ncbi:MAG: NPXTG-anchored protein [Ruminococcus sp.]|nr:NPXTG-anchored protein [Ruminococcus sp.]
MAKSKRLRAGAFLLSVAVAVSSLSFSAAAESQVIEGTYSYSSNEGNNVQRTDSFVFREDCFKHSSFDWCSHLMTLSAQTAIASVGRYADVPDPGHIDDPSDEGANILNMLKDMGFSDAEANKYYTVNPQENSAAAAIGHREISCGGKTYTLLAVFPRSANYKEEWSGNFTVGSGTIHEGFKAGRDEVLRFMKQYITKHGITGDIKIWVSGHSRGSAISNLIGAFFAAGGIDYFDGVSIAPEDIYCYTYATPRTAFVEADKKELLSVGGARGGVYADDTPGEEYVSSVSGRIYADDKIFDCIHNFPQPYDFITMLPPAEWNYTMFGKVENTDGDGAVSAEDMLRQLSSVNGYAYEEFLNGGDYRNFEWKRFDLPSFSVVPDTAEHEGNDMGYFMSHRVSSFAYYAPDVESYVSTGMQETLTAVAGAYSMMHDFTDLEIKENTQSIILPAILSYFAYADEMLKDEGRSASEEESVLIVIEELLSYITGQPIEHGSLTVDDTVMLASRYISANKDSKAVSALLDYAANAVQGMEYYALVEELLNQFVPDPDNATDQEKLLALITALTEGPQEGSLAVAFGSAENIRTSLYALLGFVSPDLSALLYNGKAPLENIVKYVIPMLLGKTDGEGGYESIADAADAGLTEVIGLISATGLENSKRYGELYYEQLKGHIETIKKNVSLLRRVLFRIAFGTFGDPYSTEQAINTAATFIGNIGIIPSAHYNEDFVAWGKACEAAGIRDHEEYKEPAPEPSDSQQEDVPEDPGKSDNPKTGSKSVCICGAVVILAAAAVIVSKKRKR